MALTVLQPCKGPGRITRSKRIKSSVMKRPSAPCGAGTQRQVASLAAEKQSLQDKLEAFLASSSATQADLSSQRERASKAEAALTEAQTKAHQLSEAAEQARQERVQAEQQVVELKAVEGQLESEVVRLQQQLQGVQGQLQVLTGLALCMPCSSDWVIAYFWVLSVPLLF